MELSQLRYFQTLSRLEHFTRAAEELHISQPSLSKSISNLEEELGVQLFDRHNRSVHLNGYGRALLVHADRILREVDEALAETRDMRAGVRGEITVASNYQLDFPGGPMEFIRRFLFDDPDISMHFYYMESSAMPPLLLERKIAFAMTTDTLSEPDIMSEELYAYRLGLVVCRDDPLAARTSVSMTELRDYPFLSNNSSPDLHNSVYEICAKAGFRPNIKLECDNEDLIGEAISRGMGVSFAAERRFLSNSRRRGSPPWVKKLAFVPVSDDYCSRVIHISYLRDAHRTSCEESFLRQLRAFFREGADRGAS